jgi:CHAD domain-containing protein
MSQSSKWIEGLAPDGSVHEAARLSLEPRLKAVAHWLPLAADQAEDDIEYVHRLRVATRRATAALKLYRDWLPKRPYRWLKKRLRAIRRAAGEARDLDVLADRLEHELGARAARLQTHIAEHRAAAQPAIVDAAARCSDKDRYLRKVHLLLAGIGPQGKGEPQCSFGDWAQTRLEQVAARSFAALPGDSEDPAVLHRFRIQVKALRYAIELLGPAFSAELRELHYPVVEELQRRLGSINDHVTGAARLREWSSATSDALLQELLDALVQQEHIRLAEGVAEFRQWWTPERLARLRAGVETPDLPAGS